MGKNALQTPSGRKFDVVYIVVASIETESHVGSN